MAELMAFREIKKAQAAEPEAFTVRARAGGQRAREHALPPQLWIRAAGGPARSVRAKDTRASPAPLGSAMARKGADRAAVGLRAGLVAHRGRAAVARARSSASVARRDRRADIVAVLPPGRVGWAPAA